MDEVDSSLPEDWANPSGGPDWVPLGEGSGGWAKLKLRYRWLGDPKALTRVFHVVGGEATLALVERDYVNADYRDEFANFYAQTFRALPDRCERVHFFDQGRQRYLGSRCCGLFMTGRFAARCSTHLQACAPTFRAAPARRPHRTAFDLWSTASRSSLRTSNMGVARTPRSG